MQSVISLIPVLALAALPVLSGCVEHQVVYVPTPAASPQPGQVISEAPPAPQPEVVVSAPAPNYAWMPGYWSWQGRWVWISGAWMVRPYPHAHWARGHWVHRGHGWVWVGGYWH